MNEKLIKVGVAQGDINGIGYELILKTFEDARVFEFCIPIIYGSSKVLQHHRKALELPAFNVHIIQQASEMVVNHVNLISCGNEDTPVELARRTKEGADAAAQAVQRALKDLEAGDIDVLLMAPTMENQLPLIEAETGKAGKAFKILVKDSLRITSVMDKVPVSEVSSLLTEELLVNRLKVVQKSLIHEFMVTTPRIAVLSFNPNANVAQNLGKEEESVILPALKAAEEAGVFCFGPYSVNTFFSAEEYLRFDAIVAIYLDQAISAFRTLAQGEGAVSIAGLPLVITSPDQSVSYEAAGKNISSESAFRNALYLAVDLFLNRKQNKKIYANPLKKMYFERGSDNEKLDLTKGE
jgi:4-hydroxythreonine-4-phosphate dehydrogenase